MNKIIMLLFASLFFVGCNPAKNKFTSVNDPLAKPSVSSEVTPDGSNTNTSTDPNTGTDSGSITDTSGNTQPASNDDTAGVPTPQPPVPIDQLPSDPTLPSQYECKTKPGKVSICHFSNSNSGVGRTLCIGAPALQAHLSHGGRTTDYLGACR